jgi:hypothetical protein
LVPLSGTSRFTGRCTMTKHLTPDTPPGAISPESSVEPEQHEFHREMPEVLTLREVAQVLRYSKAHVCKIVNGQVAGTPQLPSVPLGRRKLVRRATLFSWLAENEQGARIASSLEVDAGRRA